MIKEALEKLDLPDFPYKENLEDARREMFETLLQNEYGVMPERELSVSFEETERDKKFCAGKADLSVINITAKFKNGSFTFPARVVIPKGKEKIPFFVHINFRPDVPDKYQPTEEIIDNGFAVLSFCYNEVTSDNGDFSDGVSPFILGGDVQKEDNACGKIAMWAWAASKVMDFAETVPELDKSRAIVIGHSRLGKTALLAGASDARFALAVSNDSGCGGAALTRNKGGETVDDICRSYYYWFCRNYRKYRNNESAMPFDQHYLLACIAPWKVYCASAAEDGWSDPDMEFLCCAAAGEFFARYGLEGFNVPDRLPENGEKLFFNNVSYHKRAGAHYFGREDWLYYMEYAKKYL